MHQFSACSPFQSARDFGTDLDGTPIKKNLRVLVANAPTEFNWDVFNTRMIFTLESACCCRLYQVFEREHTVSASTHLTSGQVLTPIWPSKNLRSPPKYTAIAVFVIPNEWWKAARVKEIACKSKKKNDRMFIGMIVVMIFHLSVYPAFWHPNVSSENVSLLCVVCYSTSSLMHHHHHATIIEMHITT